MTYIYYNNNNNNNKGEKEGQVGVDLDMKPTRVEKHEQKQ
jgi:hypothetical protein